MKYLVDSDFLYGLFLSSDVHHKAAKTISEYIKHDDLYALNLVPYETATVISKKVGQEEAKLFLATYPLLEIFIYPVDTELEHEAWNVFSQQTKKGTSFVDCANLAYFQKHHLDAILSFDKFYPESKRFILDF